MRDVKVLEVVQKSTSKQNKKIRQLRHSEC